MTIDSFEFEIWIISSITNINYDIEMRIEFRSDQFNDVEYRKEYWR